MSIPSASNVPPSRPEPPECNEQTDAGDGGRQHERELDRASRRASRRAARRVAIQYAAGVPKTTISEHRDRVRLGRHAQRVLARRPCRAPRRGRRAVPAGRRRRSGAAGRGGRRSSRGRASPGRARRLLTRPWGSGRNPRSFSAAWPRGGENPLIHACAAAFLTSSRRPRSRSARAAAPTPGYGSPSPDPRPPCASVT